MIWKNAFSERAMQFTMFFLLLEGITIPNFHTFVYYYCTDELGFSETYWGMMLTFCRIGVAIGIILFAKFYRKQEPRFIMAFSIFIQLFTELFLLLVRLAVANLELSREKMLFLSIQPPIGVAMALGVLAPSCIISKITPSKVECMVFGTGMAILVAAKEFGASFMGVLWNQYLLKISTKDYKRMD